MKTKLDNPKFKRELSTVFNVNGIDSLLNRSDHELADVVIDLLALIKGLQDQQKEDKTKPIGGGIKKLGDV